MAKRKRKVYSEGDFIGLPITKNADSKTIKWINEQEKVVPAIWNVITKYVNGELVEKDKYENSLLKYFIEKMMAGVNISVAEVFSKAQTQYQIQDANNAYIESTQQNEAVADKSQTKDNSMYTSEQRISTSEEYNTEDENNQAMPDLNRGFRNRRLKNVSATPAGKKRENAESDKPNLFIKNSV